MNEFSLHIEPPLVYLTMLHANNKGADQPALPRSLFSAFVIRNLGSRIAKVATRSFNILLDGVPVGPKPRRQIFSRRGLNNIYP